MAHQNNSRIEQLKNWHTLPDLFLPPETFAYYNQKIRTTHIDIPDPYYSLPVADIIRENIHYTYLKYIMMLSFNDYVQYVESKGVDLKNDKINIRTILNEIINNTLPESYYINRKLFYCRLIDGNPRYYDYKLMDQAIKFNDQRMIHYLIFKRQEDLEWFYEDIVNNPHLYEEDHTTQPPPTIETGFASDNCIICCLEKPNILNLPCLHISTCESCEKIGKLTKCSICRMVIQRKIKI